MLKESKPEVIGMAMKNGIDLTKKVVESSSEAHNTYATNTIVQKGTVARGKTPITTKVIITRWIKNVVLTPDILFDNILLSVRPLKNKEKTMFGLAMFAFSAICFGFLSEIYYATADKKYDKCLLAACVIVSIILGFLSEIGLRMAVK